MFIVNLCNAFTVEYKPGKSVGWYFQIDNARELNGS